MLTLKFVGHFSGVSRTFWGEYVRPESMIADTLGVYCLQTFPKLLLLLVPKVTTHNLYPECIAKLKLPIDAFYRESRSGVNVAKRNKTTGLFGLCVHMLFSFLSPMLSYFPVVTGRCVN